ncbi:response regulator transcription factor [Enterococcus termitis]|jgi:two-component system secretion system response regulator SalR|uniref:HTH luxR-type domain-containing protein n=1 Tax=Enterococcus termitis TaxID=332950 RepID=A0A1E5G845_9ENTE|nr:response regulator transcription factor [Enterococcus termitis]OEG08811.1 hypothetical protein BCR25_12830 [Enterococcus termitis]OJG98293.1 hypothetical protein RV18_GL003610 [Enterococcus termitis]
MNILFFLHSEILGDSLTYSLQDRFSSVRCVYSFEDLFTSIHSDCPDILVMGIGSKVSKCFSTTKTLKKQFPRLLIIFLSDKNCYEYCNFAINNGVNAFVSHSISLKKMIEILDLVYVRGTFFQKQRCPVKKTLTEKEREILQLLADGNTQSQSAEKLSLSRRTINNHLHSIFKKLEVFSSISAVLKGVKLGIIEIDSDS